MQILSDDRYSVVMVESGCAISTCHVKVVGIQAMSDKGHGVLMETVPPAGASTEK